MKFAARAKDGFVVLKLSNNDQNLEMPLTPEESLGVILDLVEASQSALESEQRSLSIPPKERERLAIGNWAFEVKGSRDGRAAILITPENMFALELELLPEAAKDMAEAIMDAADFMKQARTRH